MTTAWKNRVGNASGSFFFAPEWYVKARVNGATKEQLLAMTRDFCRTTQGEDPEEELVVLMVDMYEA